MFLIWFWFVLLFFSSKLYVDFPLWRILLDMQTTARFPEGIRQWPAYCSSWQQCTQALVLEGCRHGWLILFSMFSSWLVQKISQQLPAMCIVPPTPPNEVVFLQFQLIFLCYYWQSELSESLDDRPKPSNQKCKSLEAQLIILDFKAHWAICTVIKGNIFFLLERRHFCSIWERKKLLIWIIPLIVCIVCWN